MKNTMKRTLAILLAVISVFGIMHFAAPVEADAAGYSYSVYGSNVTVDTKSSNFYVVTSNNVAVRKGESDRSTIYCKFNAGTVFYASGTTKNYIKIKMGNETVYIPKRNCKATATSCNVTLAYANKNCVIRSGPYETCGTVGSITKGSVVKLVGNRTVTNKHGNPWSVVYLANNKVGYVYSPNITTTSKITLTVTGNTNLLMVGDSTQLSYKVSPAVNIVWSSSNTKVATVNISGKVTANNAGTCNISATVNGIMTVSYSITVKSWESQISASYESAKRLAGREKFKGYCGLYAGCTIKSVGITRECNAQNGNSQFETYKNRTTTSGGYKVKTYSVTNSNLKATLNSIANNGKNNVKNILICYQTGTGSNGLKYGHAVFIHAVVNGKIYFSESFGTWFGGKYYAEGTPIVGTIEQFCNYYIGNGYGCEGIIYFYK